MTFDKGREWL